ncbi:winged helix-turn-helix domain-containing protein, partial [uncultured Pigmentiphaga sp.]
KPLSRERLLALARDDEAGERNDRAIDIAILRLRRAIEDDPKQPKWIQTVWGIGYRFAPLTSNGDAASATPPHS